jgi:hypothetical protein
MKVRSSHTLLLELRFGGVKIGAHFGLSSGRRVVAKFCLRNFTAGLRESGFGLRELDSVFAIVKLREQLAWLNSFSFVNENVPHHSTFHRADNAAFGRNDSRIRAHAHRPRNKYEKRSDDPGAF